MRAKIRQLFCLIVIVIIVLAIGAAAINVYMVWGTKGRILKKDQWANFKADGVVVLGCAVRPNKEASPMLNDRMQTAISFYKEASAKKMLVSGDNLNEDYDEVSVMKKLAVSGGIEADEVYMDHTGLNTYDTIVHSLEFFNKGSTIVIVTQSYHLYRALYLAQRKVSALRPTKTTFAPSFAKRMAVARPIPEPAPVTITVFSLKRFMMFSPCYHTSVII